MLTHGLVAQPRNGVEYRSLLRVAWSDGRVRRFDAAVAYATLGGVQSLIETVNSIAGGSWNGIEKRWLIGIDWLRSEPAALDSLAAIPHSQVRVHDGAHVVAQAACTPRLPYHPKVFFLGGKRYDSLVLGSGNLSRNGLRRGHEVGVVLAVRDGTSNTENSVRQQIKGLRSWFEELWSSASSWRSIRASYSDIYASRSNFDALTPTEDDSAESTTLPGTPTSRAFSAAQLRQLRAATDLWISGGTLSKNRGATLPGNQLMMKKFTRVFFGFPATDLPRDTHVGLISVRLGGTTRDDCSLRFSNNGMDVLTLLVPGNGGPATYDDSILHFHRLANGGFTLEVLPASALAGFQKRSAKLGSAFKMTTSNRPFGVF